ncbi:NAD-dependent epimerase/dehydratase family protein [Methylobacterium iners]|uniref:UDP-N-acetylglucosamine 4-epimerase n=1 Tax=Methylobacterium iners TaxID=418707 RepID=A0ABQ4S6S3_9HYPH|nr:NAD-dependent epimerase/dehydratase family protein [Methylobacterium iners]GJD98062.1 UDP-N-acetylglucosamine 4-epimerase [Methylobacterium iners]
MGIILVTGAAGFIGYHVCARLLARGEKIIGIDNYNDYYDPALKEARTDRLLTDRNFNLHRTDFSEANALADLVNKYDITRIIHLGAQAGVRYSLENPFAYERSNIAGHLSVLEACRGKKNFEHLVYASSSSVYGNRPSYGGAFSEDDRTDHPVSLYAATKRSCELMSTTYSGLFGLKQSGLRFFTVYGPWGRPDMAYYSFTKKIMAGEPIEVYGEGQLRRDFTYIDDIVNGILGVLDCPPNAGENRILNIGNDNPEDLMGFIVILEKLIGRPAIKIMRPMQPGDVTATWADISKIRLLTGYNPQVNLSKGLDCFVEWYRANIFTN